MYSRPKYNQSACCCPVRSGHRSNNKIITSDTWISWVLAERILLGVGGTEDVVAKELKCHDTSELEKVEVDGEIGQVPGLQTIHDRNPREVSEREHKSKAVYVKPPSSVKITCLLGALVFFFINAFSYLL